jgi:hypothetical protein
MASPLYHGRYTAHIEGDFVVFLIGARVNSLWKYFRIRWVGRAFWEMFRRLTKQPDYGCLGGRIYYNIASREVIAIMYWRTHDHLEHFARNADDPHLAAWRRFNHEIGNSGDFGVWHETYKVQAGAYACVYINMPRMGLAAAAEHQSIMGRGPQTSR